MFAALANGLHGIGRSLWLDEAWVANSVNAPSLSGMFVYPGWLQSNPPIFLLLSRAAIRVFGLSNASLRIVPLLFYLLAVGALLAIGRRIFAPFLAVLVGALVAFYPNAVEFSHTVKPYSEELAVTGILILATIWYLQQPGRREFGWLLAAVGGSLLLAYSAVFLWPGIFLAVGATGGPERGKRLALLTTLAGGSFLVATGFAFALMSQANYTPSGRSTSTTGSPLV
jgi:uncharacterized membrane protein